MTRKEINRLRMALDGSGRRGQQRMTGVAMKKKGEEEERVEGEAIAKGVLFLLFYEWSRAMTVGEPRGEGNVEIVKKKIIYEDRLYKK